MVVGGSRGSKVWICAEVDGRLRGGSAGGPRRGRAGFNVARSLFECDEKKNHGRHDRLVTGMRRMNTSGSGSIRLTVSWAIGSYII